MALGWVEPPTTPPHPTLPHPPPPPHTHCTHTIHTHHATITIASLNNAEIKGQFYWKRDLSMLLYFALSAAVYFLDSVPLALVVANLNL